MSYFLGGSICTSSFNQYIYILHNAYNSKLMRFSFIFVSNGLHAYQLTCLMLIFSRDFLFGLCFFESYSCIISISCRALADQLEGDQEEHEKYRKMVVQYILVCIRN